MVLFGLLALCLLTSCVPAPFTDPTEIQIGDNFGEWPDVDITCSADRPCLDGEVCVDGSCEIQRCATNLAGSLPPMGQGLGFFEEAEFAFADSANIGGGYWLDLYGGGVGDGFEDADEVSETPLNDVAGGRFVAGAQEDYVIAPQIIERVAIPSLGIDFDGIDARALGAGDVDGDGLDEIVALTTAPDVAICHVDVPTCERWTIDTAAEMVDVAVGDVDGDGFDEPVLLLHDSGAAYLYAFNPVGEDAGAFGDDYFSEVGDDALFRISAGDLDGDFVDEVVGLQPVTAPCFNCTDEIFRFNAQPDGTFTLAYQTQIANVSVGLDLELGDLDLNDVAEVVVLSDEGTVAVEAGGDAAFIQQRIVTLGSSLSPNRVALADHDGDGPSASLIDGPTPVAGAPIPMMVMLLPPYSRDYSDGVASAAFGDQVSKGEGFSDTVSLGVSADIGVKQSLFDVVGVKLSTKIDRRVSTTLSQKRKITVGSRYSIRGDPDRNGPRYGAVVVAWGCFDAYKYELNDPNGYLSEVVDANQEPLVMTVPTGGGEVLYSTARYNAIAESMGLPTIDVPYTVGDPDSYPTEPERLDGTVIPEEDMLFPTPETFTVSDIGQVSWRNSVGESVSNSTNVSTSLGVSAGVEAFGVSVGTGVSIGWGQSYSLDVGAGASFIGGIPPIPDNPRTPEDEYSVNRYSVQPWVYQEQVITPSGAETAYWVMTYTVGQ